MASKVSVKTINKLYPPQLSVSQGELYSYSPLDHWVEVHSSTSLKDVIAIEEPSSPLFLNNCETDIILQSDHSLWIKEKQSEQFNVFARRWNSEDTIVSTTQKMGKFFVNISEGGRLNLWESSNPSLQESQLKSNPESETQIGTKTIKNSSEGCSNNSIETYIDTESLVQKSRNGYSFANIICDNSSLLTLHSLSLDGEKHSRLCISQLEDPQFHTSPFRSWLPETVTSFKASNNSILAYGGQELFLLDKRCQSTVAKMDNYPGCSISSVNFQPHRSQVIEVSRDNLILLLDWRRPSEIMSLQLTVDQDIESFKTLQQKQEDLWVVTLQSNGKVKFYSKSSD